MSAIVLYQIIYWKGRNFVNFKVGHPVVSLNLWDIFLQQGFFRPGKYWCQFCQHCHLCVVPQVFAPQVRNTLWVSFRWSFSDGTHHEPLNQRNWKWSVSAIVSEKSFAQTSWELRCQAYYFGKCKQSIGYLGRTFYFLETQKSHPPTPTQPTNWDFVILDLGTNFRNTTPSTSFLESEGLCSLDLGTNSTKHNYLLPEILNLRFWDLDILQVRAFSAPVLGCLVFYLVFMKIMENSPNLHTTKIKDIDIFEASRS